MSARSTASRPQTPTLDSGNPTKPPDNGAKDNIKVSVRIRPLSEKESSRGDRAVWGTDGSGGVGLLSTSGSRLDVKFAYDVVFSAGNDNGQVFDEVAWPAIEPVLQGVSGTVFAYGVTSSGKTHTMMGTPTDAGVVPRAIQALFDRINKAEDSVFTVKLSMMEVYCEMLNDLLDRSRLNLDVQESQGGPGKGPVLLVKGLTEGQVATAEEALALIQQGQENRKVASTAFNDQSSRSHTICRFLIESSPRHSSSNAPSALYTATCSSRRDSTTGLPGSSAAAGGSSGSNVSTSAWLTLVDLAGSEGAKAALSKDQQAEARDINRSLLTLGKVMYELAKGGTAGHLPFRDSLLTRLLKPSLTGSGAKIAIICNVTPASSQSDETWNTLRFADGAKRIKVAAAKNEVLDLAAVVAQYQREVAQLKAQLAALSGAAASAGGQLSPDVLQAIQASLNNSSQENAADEAEDQAAQLHYLRECLSFASLERDQLLSINKALTAMLVQQVSLAAGAGPGADKAAVGAAAGDLQAAELGGDLGGGSSSGSSSDRACAAGALGVPKARKRTAKIRRCLSYESLEYYSQWNGRKADAARHQQQQQQQLEEPGLECNAADAAEVQQLLRLTSDELPDFLTHDAKQRLLQQQQQQMQPQLCQPQLQLQPQQQLLQHQQQLGLQEAAAGLQEATSVPVPSLLPVLGVATAAVASGALASCPASSSGLTSGPLASHRSGHGVRFASDASTASAAAAAAAGLVPPSLSKYYSAVSSFGGLSTVTDSSCPSSFQGTVAAAAAAGGVGAAGLGQIVPCPIVFPGSRRTSKTLAVAAPGSGVGGNAAGWLGFVGLPALPEGARTSALSEMVEAHRALAAQLARLELLQQQLRDKEALLEQARQLQQGQVLQLRLTITAADRALLRDKLAEAEQQIAGYKAQQSEYEQDFTELFDHVQKLQTASEQIQQERDALAAQLAALIRQTSSATHSTLTSAEAAVAAIMASPGALPAVSISRSISRCSGGSQSECNSPEPGSGSSRIPLPPSSSSSALRGIATTGGISMSPPASSRVGGSGASHSRSVGSPPRKSAAAAATFNNIKAAMMWGGAAGGAASPPSNSRGGSPAQGSSGSPRLRKLASNLPAIAVEGLSGSAVQLQQQGSDNLLVSSLRLSRSPGASPLSVSRNNSFLSQCSGPSVASLNSNSVTAGAAAAGHGPLSASFSGPSPCKDREGRDRDSKLRASWSSGLEAQQNGFNPICITSPFHRDEPGSSPASAGAGADCSGSPQNTTSSASPDVTGSALSPQHMSLLQQGKQSRIPLPPFLKRHSKRMLQQQQQQGGSGDGSSDGSSAAAPVLDKFLLALHGRNLPENQEPLPSEQHPAAAAAAAAASFRTCAAPGALQNMRSDSSSHTGAHKVPAPAGLLQKASPFASITAATGIAAERMQGPLGEGVEGVRGMEGSATQQEFMLSSEHQQRSGLDSCGASSCLVSVRSHPVKLSERLSTAAASMEHLQL